MVNYWLCVTNEENWQVVKERKIWGVSEGNRKRMERVKPGDALVFYVKPKMIRGIFKATTKPFRSDEKSFRTTGFPEEETFPNRVKLEPAIILEEALSFENLVPRLKFIINKKRWNVHLMGRAMQSIPKDDFDFIKSLASKR